MSTTCTPETQQFGENRVCRECGIPKALEKFQGKNDVVCAACVPRVERLERQIQAKINGPEQKQNRFLKEMNRHLESSSPITIEGFEKALEILGGETPQEIAAHMINELRNPGKDRADLSAEELAALPVDYKTIYRYLSMLESSGRFRDEQLAQHNPLQGLTQEEITVIVAQGAVDYSQHDRELRMQLIRGFMDRCPTFLDEVTEVARELANEKPRIVIREKGSSDGE